jgi:hypothetical protein
MSVKAMTTPVPSGSSSGVQTTATGSIEPSRRTNQSSSLLNGRPVTRAARCGHSAAGNGEPSGCL